MDSIQAAIRNAKITTDVIFVVDCELPESIEVLGDLALIRGSNEQGQAFHIQEYLVQKSPGQWGGVLNLLKECAKSQANVAVASFPDYSHASAWKAGGKLHLCLTNSNKAALVQAGEQIAWIAAALIPCSSKDYGIPIYSPLVQQTDEIRVELHQNMLKAREANAAALHVKFTITGFVGTNEDILLKYFAARPVIIGSQGGDSRGIATVARPWCGKYRSLAGSSDIKYHVTRSINTSPGTTTFGTVIKELSSQSSEYVSKSLSLSTLKLLQHIRVILWDEAEVRGWLVDGNSALLHLLKYEVEHWRAEADACPWDTIALGRLSTLSFNALSSVLADWDNLGIVLSTKECTGVGSSSESTMLTRKHYLFQDLMIERARTLIQLSTYQSILQHRGEVKGGPAKLEGWNFVDLLKPCEATSRATTLDISSCAWIGLAGAINAVTLFGRNFGDILQAVTGDEVLFNWETLPAQKGNLATSSKLLYAAMDRMHPDHLSRPCLLRMFPLDTAIEHDDSVERYWALLDQTGHALEQEEQGAVYLTRMP